MKKTTFLIVGKHAVLEALKNPNRKIERVFLTEDAQKKLNRENQNLNLFKKYKLTNSPFKLIEVVSNSSSRTVLESTNVSAISYSFSVKDLLLLSKLTEKTMLTDSKIQTASKDFIEAKGSMFLGRGYSYPIALEGALKLKELAYVHAEGYPAGEMKHGPLALIEEGMPVVVLAPRDEHYKKTISNMQEVISRGAKVLLITNKSKDEIYSENIWDTIEVENAGDDLLPFLITIPLQKLAYYSALHKGYDIDKPRNLAKSVTVE